MTASIIDGKDYASRLRGKLKFAVTDLKERYKITPGLAVVLVGNDAASEIYVRNKGIQTKEAGMESFEYRLPESTSEKDLLSKVEELNSDKSVNGILVQFPVPKHMEQQKIIEKILPSKDVDGLHPVNSGYLSSGLSGMVPCTPQGASMLIKDTLPSLSGLHAVIVGRSNLVGKPIAQFDTTMGKVADMIVATFSADCMTYRTVGMIQDAVDELDKTDPNYYIMMGNAMEKYAIETSMAKVYCSEQNGKVIDSGLQMMGGYGFIEEYNMARLYRDSRIDRIWEGTNEINRQIITGYIMKKSLMEELPVQQAIRDIDKFMSNGELKDDNGTLLTESNVVETAKRLALFLLNEGLCKFGQDLKHQQQVADILANIFMDIYVAESTILRAKKMLTNPNTHHSVEDIAKIFVAEMSQRMIPDAENALKAIYNGSLDPVILEKLNSFRNRMHLQTNTIGLKTKVADYAYTKNGYSY